MGTTIRLQGTDGPVELVLTQSASADGATNPTLLSMSSFPSLFNGTTWDRWRNNFEGTALISAARTGTTNSADIINYNGRGVTLFLNVTAASGTGGLTVNIQVKDPVSGSYFTAYAAAAAVITTGLKAYNAFPGAAGAGNYTNTVNFQIPRTFRIGVTVGDSSSYTYSIGYAITN